MALSRAFLFAFKFDNNHRCLDVPFSNHTRIQCCNNTLGNFNKIIFSINFEPIKCRQRPTLLKGFRLSAFGIFQRNNSIEHGQFGPNWTSVHFTLFCEVQLRIFNCFWLFSVRVCLIKLYVWGRPLQRNVCPTLLSVHDIKPEKLLTQKEVLRIN